MNNFVNWLHAYDAALINTYCIGGESHFPKLKETTMFTLNETEKPKKYSIGDVVKYKGLDVEIFSISNSGQSVWIRVPLINGEMIGINIDTYLLELEKEEESLYLWYFTYPWSGESLGDLSGPHSSPLYTNMKPSDCNMLIPTWEAFLAAS